MGENNLKPQKCIICKKEFWLKHQGKKSGMNIKIRQSNCKTCSKECSQKYTSNYRKIRNKHEWNIVKLYFFIPFMFIGFWTWGMKPDEYPIMNYLWIGFEFFIVIIVGISTYYHRNKSDNLLKWN